MNDPWPVSVSLWFYRGLLKAYPRKFRREYGEAMAQVFRDLCLRDVKTGLAGVWGRTLLDYAVSLVSEHIERGIEMTKTMWIKWSGWGLAASGFILMAGFEASTRPAYNPYNAAAWPIDPLLNAIDLILIAFSLLLMSAGLAGLMTRFKHRTAGIGRIGLMFGGIAGIISAVGAVGLGIVEAFPWWDLFMVGFIGLNLGLVLFGVSCLRQRLFSRWNVLPLTIGVFFLLFILSSDFIQYQWPSTMLTVVFLAFSLGLGLVGYRLQSEAVEIPATRLA